MYIYIYVTRWVKTQHIPHFMKIKIRPEIGILMCNCAAMTKLKWSVAWLPNTEWGTETSYTYTKWRGLLNYLSSSCSLTFCCLECNHIKEEGVRAFVEALQVNQCLHKLSESSHFVLHLRQCAVKCAVTVALFQAHTMLRERVQWHLQCFPTTVCNPLLH